MEPETLGKHHAAQDDEEYCSDIHISLFDLPYEIKTTFFEEV